MTSTRVIDNLRRVEIFAGLIDEELLKVADLCKAVRVPADRTIFNEGDGGDELFVIHEGSVRVLINTRAADGTVAPSTINMLYAGQCFGEMILLNSAARSATFVTSASARARLAANAASALRRSSAFSGTSMVSRTSPL